MRRSRSLPEAPTRPSAELSDQIRKVSTPLRTVADLDPLLNLVGDAHFVLLGEASHGTAEYYQWRAKISQRLIREKGFTFIAVEGDWPDCYRINRYIRGFSDSGADAREMLQTFRRWPTWMWANEEIVALAEWLRQYNAGQPDANKVGFYGLDVYSLWDSMYAVLGYLRKKDPTALQAARQAFRCFEPYGEDEQAYARSTRWVRESCEDEVVGLLRKIRNQGAKYESDGREAFFHAEQNALVVKNAEAYYRAMVRGGPDSWNVRDRHMAETLDRLVKHHGPQAKAIIWEHNTHIGDARFTDMADEGMVNVGQLVRERHDGEGVVLVGFGSHRGGVIAGQEWGGPFERMDVPSARDGSWEDVLHGLGVEDRLLMLSEAQPTRELLAARGHRAIGVVYHPDYERYGNYVPTVLPRRYDAFLYLDETEALHPLPVRADTTEVPETFPTGV
ncbi:MAG: erythromycin esterase family protein [Gemmataceae bacterium]